MNIALMIGWVETQIKHMTEVLPREVHRRRVTDKQAQAQLACAQATLRKLKQVQAQEATHV